MFCILLLAQLSVSKLQAKAEGYNSHDRIDDAGEPINFQLTSFENLGDMEVNGGGILVNKNKVNCVLTNCLFSACTGTNGGAVYIAYTGDASTYNCAISATKFLDCQSKTHGGAIYATITQSNLHSFVVTNSEFTNNVAGKSGGAIYAMVRDSCTIQHCTFNGNSGGGDGSTLWCRVGWNSKYNLNELVIEDNSFTFTPTSKKSINVYIDTYVLTGDTTPNANLRLSRCTFAKGETTLSGYKHLEISEHNAQFESIKFSGCNCVNDGEATVTLPYSYNPNAYFAFNCQSIGSCQLTPVQPTQGPSQDGQGYLVYPERLQLSYTLYPPTLRLIKAKFANLEYKKNDIGGGAVAVDRVDCVFADCVFDNCYTSAKNFGGGAVYIYYPGTSGNYSCQILTSVFNNCHVDNNGGALFLQTAQFDRHRIVVEGCTFTNNIATKLGGGLYAVSRDLITVAHCKFANNEAASGSSLYAKVGHQNGKDTDDRFTLYGNNFAFTPSEGHTTNVYIESIKLDENIEPRSHIFIGANEFSASGSYSSYHNIKIDDIGALKEVTFIGCNCIQSGMNTVSIPSTIQGVADNFITDCPGTNKCPEAQVPPATEECSVFSARREEVASLDIRKTCFANLNSPSGIDGGAIRILNAPLHLEEDTFRSCTTEVNGGAIFASYTGATCDLYIDKCLFENCKAGISGGAVYFSNEMPTNSTILNSKFFTNEAFESGGALYYSPCAKSSLEGCFFLNNKLSKPNNNRGTAVYALIRNFNNKINNDRVFIDNNRVRSEYLNNTQQVYINMKKSGNLQIGANSFSFNKYNVTTASAKYIYLASDEGSNFQVTGEICVDANTIKGVVYGFEQNVVYDCHKADEEFDNVVSKDDSDELNLGLAIGIAVACGVAVIAIVIVILVIITIRERKQGY